MLVRRGGRVVVEVIDHRGALVVGDADIELEKKGLDSGRGSLLVGKRNKDVAVFLDEFEKLIGSQRWAEAFRLCGEQEDVVVGSLIVLEECDLVALG